MTAKIFGVRITLFLLALLLMLPVLSVLADDPAVIKVGTVRAEPGDAVEVRVTVSDNSGFVGFGVALDYNTSVLEVDKVVYLPDNNNVSKFSSNNITGKCGHPLLAQCTIHPVNDKPITKACTLFTVTFKVAADAKPGRYPITPTTKTTNRTGCFYDYDNTNNLSIEIPLSFVAGYVQVGDENAVVSDVTSDPIVDPGKTSDVTSDPAVDPGKTSDVTSGGKTSDPIVDPGKTSDGKTSGKTSDGKTSAPVVDPGKTSDVTSEKTSGKTSDVTSEKTSDRTSDVTSEITSDVTSDVTSGATSEKTSEGDVTTGEVTSGGSEKTDPIDTDTYGKRQNNTLKPVLLVAGIILLAAAAGFGIWKLIPILKNKKENRE